MGFKFLDGRIYDSEYDIPSVKALLDAKQSDIIYLLNFIKSVSLENKKETNRSRWEFLYKETKNGYTKIYIRCPKCLRCIKVGEKYHLKHSKLSNTEKDKILKEYPYCNCGAKMDEEG